MHNMPTIVADVPSIDVPLWAILERRLFEVLNGAAEETMRRYVRPDGGLMWPVSADYAGIEALDDTYESFHNWPLLYALGGSESLLALSHRQFEAITAQMARHDTGFGYPKVVGEYEPGYDWFHQGEGYLFFYLLSLADPGNETMRRRAIRFAGLYLNEDAGAINFDGERTMMLSPFPGSAGALNRHFETFVPWGYKDWKRYYGLPFQDIEGVVTIEDVKDPDKAKRMGEAMRDRMSRGDVPMNLLATGMVANAYLLTGDEKYRRWALNYVDAWIERTRANGGIVPDNVGPGGAVGERTGGKWYGGYYGWTYPHGWHSIGCAVVASAENATLLSGDVRYMDFPRSQIDALIALGIERDGTLHVPYKHGDPGWYDYDLWIDSVLLDDGTASVPDRQGSAPLLWRDGWFEFQPMEPHHMTHVWFMSRRRDDMERLRRLRRNRNGPPEKVKRGTKVKKDGGGHDDQWIAYLNGEYPDYPVDILRYNLAQASYKLEFMKRDRQPPETYKDSYLQQRNPVTVEGLVQLTLGAPRVIYNGGLLTASVRYFDPERRRPGLPEGVAALVESIGDDHVVLHLVNTDSFRPATVVVQAGAYTEHRFTEVSYRSRLDELSMPAFPADMTALRTESRRLTVGGPWLRVRLLAGCEIRIKAGMERFVGRPTLDWPWGTGTEGGGEA